MHDSPDQQSLMKFSWYSGRPQAIEMRNERSGNERRNTLLRSKHGSKPMKKEKSNATLHCKSQLELPRRKTCD